jgi:hypothetical protein
MRFLQLWLIPILLLPLWAEGQHVELGVFANYDRPNLPQAPENLYGAGGRANANITSILQIELEGAYDFKYPQFQTAQQIGAVVLTSSKLGILHGNAGLKLQTRGGSLFVFVKGGVNQYRVESQVATALGVPVTLSVVQLPDREFVKGIFYPGGGIGFHAGPLGIRLDIGDEIRWSGGSANHSLRVTFGPTFRF